MAGEQPQGPGGLMANINVTPFVDVVLVLLVIFMITAPMMMKDILEVKLPKTTTSDGPILETLGVAINRDGNVLLNGKLVDDSALVLMIQEALRVKPDTQAIISADQDVVYSRVVRVIDLLKTNGLERFALQIEKEASADSEK